MKGGKVYGKWPGLAAGQLFETRDLAVTIKNLDQTAWAEATFEFQVKEREDAAPAEDRR